MIYGYARVSTQGQDIEVQIQQLKEAGCEKIFSEKSTGSKSDRQEFQKLMNMLEEGDSLVVTKLDRFARSTIDAITTVKNLFDRGVKVNVLNLGVIENTPQGKLIFSVFSAFAEFERELIVERMKEGKEIAKQKPDFREGRPRKYGKKKIEHALELLESNSYKEVEQLTGISKSTLIRAKRRLEQKV
ncbi:recombinase family protein [Bacillus dakarensis]|uniref:recombinase family protein n=1 Tax=Robertmurraya dakarensis TaxID=1926278 RepID=UPI0009812AF8|nr:recombinase family protein [Bacillus dakarensis]